MPVTADDRASSRCVAAPSRNQALRGSCCRCAAALCRSQGTNAAPPHDVSLRRFVLGSGPQNLRGRASAGRELRSRRPTRGAAAQQRPAEARAPMQLLPTTSRYDVSFWGRGPKTQGWGPPGFTPGGAGAKPPETARGAAAKQLPSEARAFEAVAASKGDEFPHMDSNHDSGIQSPLSCL